MDNGARRPAVGARGDLRCGLQWDFAPGPGRPKTRVPQLGVVTGQGLRASLFVVHCRWPGGDRRSGPGGPPVTVQSAFGVAKRRDVD